MTDGYIAGDLEEGMESELPVVDFEAQPVDPDQPGFASLLTALRSVREGAMDPEVLERYVDGLAPRLAASFQQWEQVARQPLEELGMSPEQASQLQGAFSATVALMEELELVLQLVEEGLQHPEGPAWDEAERRLEAVQCEILAALG